MRGRFISRSLTAFHMESSVIFRHCSSLNSADNSLQIVCNLFSPVMPGYGPGLAPGGLSPSKIDSKSTIQRVFHRSHLLDSFPFVILWIHVLDGKPCVVAFSILLWPWNLTDIIFNHSPSHKFPFVLTLPEEPVRCIGCRDWPFLVLHE